MSHYSNFKQFLQSVTGLSHKIITQTTDHFQSQVALQGFFMLWSPIVASLIVFVGVSIVYSSWPAALASAIFVGAVIYQVDLYATVQLGSPSWKNYLMRLALFVGLVLLDVICLELIINKNQIADEANDRFNTEQLIIIDSLQQLLDTAIAGRTLLYVKKSKLGQENTKLLEKINDEINGQGSTGETGEGDVAKALIRQYNQYLTDVYNPAVTSYNARIAEDSILIASLRSQINIETNAPFIFSKVGIGERLSILRQLSHQPEGWSIRLVFFIITTLVFVSDFLPIFHRHVMDFSQYKQIHDSLRLIMLEEKDHKQKAKSVDLQHYYAHEATKSKIGWKSKGAAQLRTEKRQQRRIKYEDVRTSHQEAISYYRLIVHDHTKAMHHARSEEERNVLQDNLSRALRDLEDIALDDLLDNINLK